MDFQGFGRIEGAPNKADAFFVICFPSLIGSPNYLAMKDQSDVGSLSCQVTFKPVSMPLQHGFRFF
jgi:hypothetical protein